MNNGERNKLGGRAVEQRLDAPARRVAPRVPNDEHPAHIERGDAHGSGRLPLGDRPQPVERGAVLDNIRDDRAQAGSAALELGHEALGLVAARAPLRANSSTSARGSIGAARPESLQRSEKASAHITSARTTTAGRMQSGCRTMHARRIT